MALSPDIITPLPIESASKFDRGSGFRPMLSRDADSMYWMCRYVERAEHVARLLMINTNLLIDVGDLDPTVLEKLWLTVLQVVRLSHPPEGTAALPDRVSRYMTFEPTNPNSILTCISRARENARAIREGISAEMWECLNKIYLAITSDQARSRFEDNRDDFYRSILTGSMLFQGLTDQTLPREQQWHFAQAAKYCERIDVTARILETRWQILASGGTTIETPIRNIHWMGVLRSCCSIEAYRREHGGELNALVVAQFLILRDHFPRSIRYCVCQAVDALAGIRVGTPREVDPAERILGRLRAQLEYAEMAEILHVGVPAYLQDIQDQIHAATVAVQKAYFLH